MYIIEDRNTGTEVDRQTAPYYVHIGSNGCWQKCKRQDAMALSVHGKLHKLDTVTYPDELPNGNWAYSVPGDPASVPTVNVYERDDGELSHQEHRDIEGHTAQIGNVELGVCEQAVTTEERLAQIELALCELAEGGLV